MPKLELEPFRRVLKGDLEPTDHQRRFLYIPLPIFRDYTNIRDIVIKHNGRRDGKALHEIAIKHKIQHCHDEMGKLDQWEKLHLDELDYTWLASDVQQDAYIWAMSEEIRPKAHRELSEHERQFAYLPLDILKHATNIGELVINTVAKGHQEFLDLAITGIHKQMARKRGKWYKELANLRFIESIDDRVHDESAEPNHGESYNTNQSVTTKKIVQKRTEPQPQPSTSKAMPKSIKNASKATTSNETPNQSPRLLRSRKSDLSTDRDESPKKVSKKDATPSTGTAKSKSTPTPKSSTSNVAEERRITRRMSIELTPQVRELRKRKSDLTSGENEIPPKKPNTPAQQQKKSTPKSVTAKAPEVIRSPKKIPAPSMVKKNVDKPRRDLTPQKSGSSRNDDVPSKEGENSSDTANGKSKSVQTTLKSWAKPSRKPKHPEDVLPKRQIVPKPPTPAATAPRTRSTKNLNQTDKMVQNDAENENNERNDDVIVSSDATNISNGGEVEADPNAEADDYNQSEDELIQLPERRECNAEDRRRQREACSPSDFQRKILALNYEDFITKTNIKELVQKEHQKVRNDENLVLTDAAMNPRLEFYYEYRKRTQEWHKNCIKNLKFTQTVAESQPQSAPQSQPVPNNSNAMVENPKKKGAKEKSENLDLNEFQREIMALSPEEFLSETNIREIIERDFHKQFQDRRRVFTQNDLNFGLKHYEGQRNNVPTLWHRSSMHHLKFKKCECKRKKQFEDKSVAMDVVETREIGCGTDFDDDQQQTLQLAGLTVQAIHDSQIICIANLSAGASELNDEQETNAEVHQRDDSRPTDTQDATMLPSQITPQSGETHYSSSGTFGATSGKDVSADLFPTQPSQQILSLAEVRMSELIVGSAPVQNAFLLAKNPLDTEVVAIPVAVLVPDEQLHEATTQPRDSSQFEPHQNSTPISSSPNKANEKDDVSHTESQIESQTPTSSTLLAKIKVEPGLDYHLGDDSDVICMGEPSNSIVDLLADEPTTQELFYQCDANTLRESLITVTTQPSPKNEIASRDELINILQGDSPVIEDSESPQNNSPFRNIVNIQAPVDDQPATKTPTPKKRQPTIFIPPRSNININANANTKKRKTTNNDDLSTIPVPKYNYRELEFCVRTKSNPGLQVQPNDATNTNDQLEIETSQTSPKQTTNYSIEDSSSADETTVVDSVTSHANGMITDSCAERVNLLNQDNTLFLGINTQQLYSACPSQPNPMTHHASSQPSSPSTDPTTTNATNQNEETNEIQQPEVAITSSVSLPGPTSSTSSIASRLTGDRTEFLHFVDIRTIQSSLKSAISATGERVSRLAIETTLQHQCNANNRIVVQGDALKLIMKLTDKEWAAVKSILTTIGTFWFESSKSNDPMDGSLLHRAMYFLFKASSKVSNVHISYGDSDLETARVFCKPNESSTENLTSTISPFVLAAMKAKAQEQQQQQQNNID